MKYLIVLLIVFLSSCATVSEFIEGDFDSKEEFQAAVDQVLSEHKLSADIEARLQTELYSLWDKYREAVIDYDELRTSLRVRILQAIAG